MTSRTVNMMKSLATNSDFQEALREVCAEQVRLSVDAMRTNLQAGQIALAQRSDAEACVFENLPLILRDYAKRKPTS